jgi:hypothetical protein
MTAKYIVSIGGSSWSRGPELSAYTITEARKIAESYGTTADWATITTASGRVVASHRRDPNGDGTRWFRAVI